jgi:hypothetical protein
MPIHRLAHVMQHGREQFWNQMPMQCYGPATPNPQSAGNAGAPATYFYKKQESPPQLPGGVSAPPQTHNSTKSQRA